MRLKKFIPTAILLTVSLFSQTHFTPVWSGFPLQAFAVYVDAAVINGYGLYAGCMDPLALNYDPDATIDDGSCEFPGMGDANGDGIRNVVDVVLLVDIALNPENYAFLFWMDLNDDTFINILDIVMLVDWILYPELVGCTNLCAGNYDPEALYDDGSCIGDMAADYDGNCYETVQIGAQLWMAENLKVTHYNNGDPIPTGYSDSQWGNLSTGAYAVYNNDPALAETYGNLYNWYAVDDDHGICPVGWHVPTDEEWMELEMALGMSWEEAHDQSWRGTDQGSQLAGRADLWTNGALENNPAFGSSGFNALPSGSRDYYGSFYGIGSYGSWWSATETDGSWWSATETDDSWWSATETDTYVAWNRSMRSNYSYVSRYYFSKELGFSVRCFSPVE